MQKSNCIKIFVLNQYFIDMKIANYIITGVLALTSLNVSAQKLNVDTQQSTINWLGEKIGGQHEGNIKLKSGALEIKNEQIVSGEFTIDMNSITCTDLKNDTYNQKLVGHLKSDDFFGVANFPTAVLNITKSTKFSNNKATVMGNITIKGKTEAISFDVVKSQGVYSVVLKVDRSKFGVKYGSKSFFDSLGDKAIDDIFTLTIKLKTK